MYYTYILRSLKDKNNYTGYTDNLQRRFKEHQEGKASATRHRRPLELIYYEACLNQQDATQREKYLKSGRGKQFLKKRLKEYLK